MAEGEWLRSSYRCTRCDSLPRERALMCVMAERYPNWRDLVVHESSPVRRGVSRLLQTQCRRYVASQYLPNQEPGRVVNGIRCENLEAMSFGSESIDLHITQDVFEHLFSPEKAFAEIARTLRAGGAHIFTVPLVNKDQPSVRRAVLDANGQPQFLLAPQYHSNPVDPAGSLVTFDWGHDITRTIFEACGLDTHRVVIDDISRGIRAEYIDVLVTVKSSGSVVTERSPGRPKM